MFVRDMGEGYFIVSNSKQYERSFAILSASKLKEVMEKSGDNESAEDIQTAIDAIKENNRVHFFKLRSMRKDKKNDGQN